MFNELYCWNEFVWKRWEKSGRSVLYHRGNPWPIQQGTRKFAHVWRQVKNTNTQACISNEEEHARKCLIILTDLTSSSVWYLQRAKQELQGRVSTTFGRSHLKVPVVSHCQHSHGTTALAGPEADCKPHPWCTDISPKGWKNTVKAVGKRFLFWNFVCLYYTNHYYSSPGFIIKSSDHIGL